MLDLIAGDGTLGRGDTAFADATADHLPTGGRRGH